MSRIFGIEAVREARRLWPDLLPVLHPIVVAAPSPPMLDPSWDEERRIGFLVEAYLSFAQLHCPVVELQHARVMALGARRGEGRMAADRRKIAAAAKILAGEGWGMLAEIAEAGKLPPAIAPHSWLLWSASTLWGPARGPRNPARFPMIGDIFTPRRLLQLKTLHHFSHTAENIAAGSTRSGANWAEREGIGGAYRALRAREQAIYRLGLDPAGGRSGCEQDLRAVGACVFGADLLAADTWERDKAREVEQRLERLAEAGTWVWGPWLAGPAARKAA